MHVEILTPDKTLFSGEAEVVTLPGVTGSFQLLKNHAPMVANLAKGSVSIESAGKKESFDIRSGLVEVLQNKVVVLV